jgi:hypothetical protein
MLGPVCWCGAAIWFDLPANYDFPFKQMVAGILAGSFFLGCLLILLFVRPLVRSLWGVSAAIVIIVLWWLFIPPQNDRDWQPDVARPATASIDGNLLTISNLRNFDYRSETDFSENWETRTYDLAELMGVDIFFSFWGPTRISHTMVSWEFSNGSHLAISIETRKEKGESYSALRGFFRQFELYYVVADERDVIRLRTNYRGEQVFLYRSTFSPEQAQLLLLDYLREVNRLAEHPTWYNALTQNCTTTIRLHAKNVKLAQSVDWRILVNGYADKLGYERGLLDTSLPFEELRKRSNITETAKAADQDPAFSIRIREAIPTPRR